MVAAVKPTPADPTICLVGHPFAPIGMGEHVRSSWRAFSAAGFSPVVRDIYGLNDRDDESYENEFSSVLTFRLSRHINIFHINGDEVEQAIPHLNDSRFSDAYNIIYPAWELSKYPKEWAVQLQKFDEIWAPSEFILDSIKSAGVKAPVIHMPLAVEVRLSSFLSRRHFGIPENAFVFLSFMDFGSYIERKNPQATLTAFERLLTAFPGTPLHCVIKMKGENVQDRIPPDLRAGLAKLSERITFMSEALSDNEVKNLVRACDCFVSLHRSEGFGRGMAESMRLGRATVGTRYSGNLDFMNDETSLLVDCDLIKVPAGAYPYAEGQVWAEPRIADAVDKMARLISDPQLAGRLGKAAQIHMRSHFSARAVGVRYAARITELLERKRTSQVLRSLK